MGTNRHLQGSLASHPMGCLFDRNIHMVNNYLQLHFKYTQGQQWIKNGKLLKPYSTLYLHLNQSTLISTGCIHRWPGGVDHTAATTHLPAATWTTAWHEATNACHHKPHSQWLWNKQGEFVTEVISACAEAANDSWNYYKYLLYWLFCRISIDFFRWIIHGLNVPLNCTRMPSFKFGILQFLTNLV